MIDGINLLPAPLFLSKEHYWLLIFHNIWDVILPIHELIFFKMVSRVSWKNNPCYHPDLETGLSCPTLQEQRAAAAVFDGCGGLSIQSAEGAPGVWRGGETTWLISTWGETTVYWDILGLYYSFYIQYV